MQGESSIGQKSQRNRFMKKIAVGAMALLAASAVFAHPHFQKSTSAELPGEIQASVSYFTVPGNESHAASTEVGAFVAPGLAKLELSKAVKAGMSSVPAGTYTVGAIKNSADSWTMALSPGALEFGDSPDMSKLIKLDSEYEKSSETIDHLSVDITPGHGKFEGKAVVALSFGSMRLVGALADGE